MNKILTLFYILLSMSSYAQGNTEALHHYFKFVEVLKKDQPLSDSLWQSFLLQAGNRLYIESNGMPEQYLDEYRKKMEIVYRPSKANLLKEKLPNDQLMQIIDRYKVEESKLKAHIEWIEKTALLDFMIRFARQYLPQRLHPLPLQPEIYYTTLGNDGSSFSKGVIVSLMTSYELDRIKAGAFGGHEIHHFLRKSKLVKPLNKPHKGLYYALDAILNEGLADLVDKPYFLGEQSEWDQKESYRQYLLGKAPAAIQALNQAIQKHAESESQYLDEQQYRQLLENSVGHIPGYFMAKIIQENGLLDALVEQADNPFAFVKLYNKAAKRDKSQPVRFSQKTVNYLNKLDKYYDIN